MSEPSHPSSNPQSARPGAGAAWPALAWFAAAVFMFLAAAGWYGRSAGELALAAGSTSLGMVCLAIGGATLSGRAPAERLGWTPSGVGIPVVCALVLGLLALSQLADWLITFAGLRGEGTLGEFRGAVREISGTTLVLSLVGLAVLPGFGEELAFRGLVQRGLQTRLGPFAAIGLASALFGLVHGDPIHGTAAFVLGLYLGAATWLADSIRPAIVCHLLNNLMATVTVALGIDWLATAIVVLGVPAGAWAFHRLRLHHRAARFVHTAEASALKESPESVSAD